MRKNDDGTNEHNKYNNAGGGNVFTHFCVYIYLQTSKSVLVVVRFTQKDVNMPFYLIS